MGMRVGIVGVSGYGGGEVLRLCATHPTFEVVYVAGEGSAGQKLVERFGADCRGIGPNATMEMQELDANLVGKCLRLLRNCGDPREGLGANVACERRAIDCAHLPPWIQPAPTRQAGTSDGWSLAPALDPKQPEDSRKGSRHVETVAALLSGLARLG